MYELAPGEESPYHWHFGEEEWLLVVDGAPTLRTPDGERVLRAWDVAVFPRGEAGAHQVRNDGAEPARVFFLSTVSDPDVRVYPDSGKVAVTAGRSRPGRAAGARLRGGRVTEVVNLLDVAAGEEIERDGFRSRFVSIRPQLGGELLGCSVYDVPPGERLWPYHYHLGNEEWLVVVAGRPTLRVPAGERELAPADVVAFPEGEDGAHTLVNRTDEDARVAIFSTLRRGTRSTRTAARSARPSASYRVGGRGRLLGR